MFVTRVLTNNPSELALADATLAANLRVEFALVDSVTKRSISAWDSLDNYRVTSTPIEIRTNASGIFSVSLWPTDRAISSCVYRCRVYSKFVEEFFAPLPSGDTSYSWITFYNSRI